MPDDTTGGGPGGLRVHYDGACYPGVEITRGAAYELFSDVPADGFLPNPRPGAPWPYRRFVHATEAIRLDEPPGTDDPSRMDDLLGTGGTGSAEPLDGPLAMPVSRTVSWGALHLLSQTTPERYAPGEAALLATVRRSATVGRGTPMLKVLSARQVAGYLIGWPLTGFCNREYDLAHLRTPAELASLNGACGPDDEVVFALRWRAVDPRDYVIPLHRALCPHGAGETDAGGLIGMPPGERIGPQVLGTGFAPMDRHLVPEWMVTDLADLPLPAGAGIVAFTADGSEVVLYTYLPEQRAWLRMCGPQWRGLLGRIPSTGPAEQEYFPVPAPGSRLVGTYQGQLHEAIADPPAEFRIASRTRSARYPVDSPARRTRYATWRGVRCTVVRVHEGWRQVRLCTPDQERVRLLDATPVERGVYEAWAPAAELADDREIDLAYHAAA